MMPVMDGYQLCKEVKSDMELSHIPIIFLTAKNDIDSKINGLKYGAEAYVEKPFSFNYLKEQVLALLDNRRRTYGRHTLYEPFQFVKENQDAVQLVSA